MASCSLRLAALTIAGFLLTAAPGHAAPGPQARLVHCGVDTCLRISGYRPDASTPVRIGGRDLAVEGGRSWRATIPFATARRWVNASGDTLTLTLVDTKANTTIMQTVILPSGAFGRQIELASLVVRAH